MERQTLDDLNSRSYFQLPPETHYFLSAAVGPLYKDVVEECTSWNQMLAKKGAIADPEIFKLMDDVKHPLAKILGVTDPKRLAIGPNTSTNMNIVAMILKDRSPKREVITSSMEFPSSSLPWKHQGFKLIKVGGKIQDQEILDRVGPDTAAVVLSAIQYSTGFRKNFSFLGTELKKLGIPFVVNGTQAIGAFPLNIEKNNISFFSATGHKWLCSGFSGAVLYCDSFWSQKIRPPLLGWLSIQDPFSFNIDNPDLKGFPQNMELGTPNILGLVALKKASEIVLNIGLENISKRILLLSSLFYEATRELDYCRKSVVETSFSLDGIESGIMSFETEKSEDIQRALEEKNFYVSVRKGPLRISIHFFNSESEVLELAKDLNSMMSMG